MAEFTTRDGARIHYSVEGAGRPLVMLHGWRASGAFFDDCAARLAQNFQVVRMDFRSHGESENVDFGHRVSRYAFDFAGLLEELDLTDVCALGWSLGSSVIWNYLELFASDNERVTSCIFCDMGPCQFTGPDWKWGQNACYDIASFTRLMMRLDYEPEATAREFALACLAGEHPESLIEKLTSENLKCDIESAKHIMADQTFIDWRDFIPLIDLPSLVLVGRKSQVFDWQASAWVGEHIEGAGTIFFENSGHALFLDEPDKFVDAVATFAAREA